MKKVKTKKRIIRKPFLFFVIIVLVLIAFASLWIFSDYGFVGKAVKMELIKSSTPQCSDGIDNDKDTLIDWGYALGNDPSCSSPFGNSEAVQFHTNIGWNDFPNFNLNPKLTAVYGGIQLAGCYGSTGICVKNVSGTTPLQKGFTHIAIFEGLTQQQKDSIPPEKRADTWVPFGTMYSGNSSIKVRGEPFLKYLIPWNNSLDLFKSAAKEELALKANDFSNSKGRGVPKIGLLVADIENMHPYSKDIINLRKNQTIIPFIPSEFRLGVQNQLTDEEFVNQYKHDMAWFYNMLNEYPESVGFTGKVSSYADAPLQIEFAWLWYESTIDWKGWTSREIFSKTCGIEPWLRSCANYLTFNFGNFMQKPGADFFSLGKLTTETLDFLAPSGYYAIKYNDDFNNFGAAGQNFYDPLFKVEANAAWSQGKPVLIFQMPRVHDSNVQYGGRGINPWMAHAMAIFPYFTKNAGIWLWDWIGADYVDNWKRKDGSMHPAWEEYKNQIKSDAYLSENRIAYDSFIYGLYRLSQYNEFFNGDYQAYNLKDARALTVLSGQENYKDAGSNTWRGIIKEDGTQMLVAAYNPFAKFDEITKFKITCPPSDAKKYTCVEGAILGEIQTTGLNVWLGVCNLDGSGCKGDQGEKLTFCGNGKKEGSEECDDGNKVNGDGCSTACKKEGARALPKKKILKI